MRLPQRHELNEFEAQKKLHEVRPWTRRSVPGVPQARPGRGRRRGDFGAALPSISSSLGKQREPGVEAQLCELDDKAFGPGLL
jgi:hypothetical protein